MRTAALALLSLMALPGTAAAAPLVEDCGWLVPESDALVPKPDASLKPSDPSPLASPPPQAKAAYCIRNTLVTQIGDERLIEAGLPLVIRSGDNEGVLEADPTVMFNYHQVGDKYLPGRTAQ